MYGDTDEFPEAIVFEEDKWLVEGEKRSLNFKYEDMVKYFFLIINYASSQKEIV